VGKEGGLEKGMVASVAEGTSEVAKMECVEECLKEVESWDAEAAGKSGLEGGWVKGQLVWEMKEDFGVGMQVEEEAEGG
jgi:hypothetical protein